MTQAIKTIEQHYRPADVATLLNVSVRTVMRWVEDGRCSRGRRGIWPVSQPSRSMLIPASAVERFLTRSQLPTAR